MLKPLLLAAAALSLTACVAPEPVRHVFISGPGEHSVIHTRDGRNRVVIIGRDGRDVHGARVRADALRQAADARRQAAEARRHAHEAVRMARLARPDPAELDRMVREARANGEQARRIGELARREGEAARRQGEEARRRGEALRQEAGRLREQCERGEIACEIIDRPAGRSMVITKQN